MPVIFLLDVANKKPFFIKPASTVHELKFPVKKYNFSWSQNFVPHPQLLHRDNFACYCINNHNKVVLLNTST